MKEVVQLDEYRKNLTKSPKKADLSTKGVLVKMKTKVQIIQEKMKVEKMIDCSFSKNKA